MQFFHSFPTYQSHHVCRRLRFGPAPSVAVLRQQEDLGTKEATDSQIPCLCLYTEITRAVREDESMSQSANSLLSFRANLPQWHLRFAVPALRDHNTGWPNNPLWSTHSFASTPSLLSFSYARCVRAGEKTAGQTTGRKRLWMVRRPLCSWRPAGSRRDDSHVCLSAARGAPWDTQGAIKLQNMPAPCGARREAACGTAAAGAAATARWPLLDQAGISRDLQQRWWAGSCKVWRGESLGEAVRGSGCWEDLGRQRGIAAGSGGRTSELGQWDSQGGWGRRWRGRGSQAGENLGLWLVGPGNLGTPVISI